MFFNKSPFDFKNPLFGTVDTLNLYSKPEEQTNKCEDVFQE